MICLKHTISTNLWRWNGWNDFLIKSYSYHIQNFHTLVRTNVITHWMSLLSTAGESVWVCPQSHTVILGPNLGPVAPPLGLPQIWPDQILPICSAYVISKNHFCMPFSSRVISCRRTFLSCVLLYVWFKFESWPSGIRQISGFCRHRCPGKNEGVYGLTYWIHAKMHVN